MSYLLNNARSKIYISNDLIQTIQSQGELTRRCVIKCFEDQTTRHEEQKELMDTIGKSTKECIETCTETIVSCIKTSLPTTNKATQQRIKTHNPDKFDWTNELTDRKLHFYKYLKNRKLHDIYIKEFPMMPRKFQPVNIQNEPEDEFKIRKKRAINTFRSEIELLKARFTRHREDFKRKDEETIAKIKIKHPREADELIKKWEKECKEGKQNLKPSTKETKSS